MERTLPALLVIGAVTVLAALLLVGPAEGSTGLATYDRPLAERLTGWDDPRLQRQAGESDLAFAQRVSGVVSDAIYHCDPDTPQSLLSPLVAGEQGILHPAHLRCGFCHQVAFVLAETLRRGRIDAYPLGLDGHVVTAFTLEGTEYVADPDYGVGPFAVDWTDPLPSVQAAYGDKVEPVAAIYADTSTDAPYWSLFTLRAEAARQGQVLAALPLVLLAGVVGLLLSRSRLRPAK